MADVNPPNNLARKMRKQRDTCDQYIFLIVVDISGESGGNVICIFGETWLTQYTDVLPKRSINE